MTRFFASLALGLCLAMPASAQDLVDEGFASGWNIMMDPAMGNGCLIQTIYQDLSVVRIGYDATNNRGYFVVFNKAWGDIKKGETYPITFDLDGETFKENAQGLYLDRVPGGIVFFKDPAFLDAIAKRKHMIVYNSAGETVMKIELAGTSDALSHARNCQKNAS